MLETQLQELNTNIQTLIATLRGGAVPDAAPPAAPATGATAPAPELPPKSEAMPPDVDADGLPWDARIHASSQAVNADGTWRKKRGVQDHVVTSVEAELRASQPEPGAEPEPDSNAEEPKQEAAPEKAPDPSAQQTTVEDPDALPAATTEPNLSADAARAELMQIVRKVGPGPVKALIAEYAPELVKVPDDQLPTLLERARALQP